MEDSIDKRIKLLIEDLGLSANSFAKELSVNTTVIYNILKGRNKPSYDLTQKIAKIFEVNTAWLFFGDLPIFISNKWGNIKGNKQGNNLNKSESTEKHKEYVKSIKTLERFLQEDKEINLAYSKCHEFAGRVEALSILIHKYINKDIDTLTDKITKSNAWDVFPSDFIKENKEILDSLVNFSNTFESLSILIKEKIKEFEKYDTKKIVLKIGSNI